MAEAPALTLDDFARLTARLQSGVPRDRALEQAGLEEDAWLSAQQAWLARIATHAAAGDRALHERFLERLEAHQKEQQSKPKQTPKMALPLPPAARRAPRPVRGRPKKAPPAATPAPRIVLPAPRKEVDLFATMAFEAIAPTGAALPFVQDEDGEETLEPDLPRKKLPRALPFEAEADISSTLEPPASTLDPEDKGPALPFKGGTSKARKDPSNSATPFRKAEVDEAEDPLASTVTGDGLAIVEPALPFSPVTPAPRKGRPVTGSGLPFRRAAPPPDDNASTTMLSPEELAKALAQEKKPDPLASTIAVAHAREEPRLTLEQFASLTAEVGLTPQDEAKLEQRYGLARGGLAREKAAWAFRFLDDAKLSADYTRKIREYRTWLQKRR